MTKFLNETYQCAYMALLYCAAGITFGITLTFDYLAAGFAFLTDVLEDKFDEILESLDD
tara:strand:- start:288 stop:464 length:177 start_codon:yes stop_codon:yes gene_type:complete